VDSLPAGQELPAPTPPITVTTGDLPVALPPAAGPAPWERRQPQFAKRSVLPVEFFRRMPGGGTTYAPVDADLGVDRDAG
jgi:hypothetical protein